MFKIKDNKKNEIMFIADDNPKAQKIKDGHNFYIEDSGELIISDIISTDNTLYQIKNDLTDKPNATPVQLRQAILDLIELLIKDGE